MKERQSNIELLRCFAMLCIIEKPIKSVLQFIKKYVIIITLKINKNSNEGQHKYIISYREPK